MPDQNFTLPATYIGKQPVSGLDAIGGGFSPLPSHGMSTHQILNNISIQVFNQIDAVISFTSNNYTAQSLQLPQSIELELANVRAEIPSESLSPAAAAIREIGITSTLIHRKEIELSATKILADSFYGSNPHDKTLEQFSDRASQIDRDIYKIGPTLQAWADAYQAEYTARLLTQSIELLNQQRANLQNQLVIAQAEEQRLLAAQQEAQRLAAELARINEEAEVRAREQARLAALEEARLAAEEQARIAALEEARLAAEEQARIAALEEARRAAEEQARIAAEAEAQQVAAERAHLEALAEQKRLEEQRQAEENAKKTTLSMAGSAAASGPLFAGTAGTLVVSQATSLAIRSALQSALSAATAAAVGSAGAVASGFAALVYPSPLGNSDLYSLSVPLADLSPSANQNLRATVPASAQVKLTVATGSKANENAIEYFVVATNGTTVPFDVPVQLATYDPVRKVYTTQSPGLPSIGMTWTPIVQPGDASTTLPTSEPGVVVYEGATLTALEGRIDAFPELDLDSLGGFITVFPADSGIPPIYTMFRDRRDDAGTAIGDGEVISGVWLGAASQSEGAAIPMQIADKFRGKEFSNFRAFRESLWKAVAGDADLGKQFTANNIQEMKNGRAPFPRKIDRLGGQVKFELHHVNQISKGGEVYGIDNIRIVTPKRHSEIHKGEK